MRMNFLHSVRNVSSNCIRLRLHFIGCFLKNSHIKSFAEMSNVDLPMKLMGDF